MKLFIITLVATVATIQASPLKAGCTATTYAEVAGVLQNCTTLVLKDITVPANTILQLNLKTGASLTFQGTIKWAKSNNFEGPMIEIKGSNVKVDGTGATLDGEGKNYWDGQGDKGTVKPKFLRIKTTGKSTVSNINLLNCPVQCVSINSASDTVVEHFNVDVSAGDANGGHNTDGFDISSSTGITIQHSTVKNQDDCVAVNQGSGFIFNNLTCSGGHGLSLSVGQSSASGSPNTLSNVKFTNCIVTNSDNGIHIKTHSDAGTGSVSDVTYQNIQLSGIRKYGINIEQDYEKGKPTGTPKGNIPITKLTMSGITGSMTGSNGMSVFILCADNACNNWTAWSNVSIANNGGKKDSCNPDPPGFKCNE